MQSYERYLHELVGCISKECCEWSLQHTAEYPYPPRPQSHLPLIRLSQLPPNLLFPVPKARYTQKVIDATYMCPPCEPRACQPSPPPNAVAMPHSSSPANPRPPKTQAKLVLHAAAVMRGPRFSLSSLNSASCAESSCRTSSMGHACSRRLRPAAKGRTMLRIASVVIHVCFARG